MLSFPCNSVELCAELHFLISNFLSFIVLCRYDKFFTRKYSRFTKSFKNKPMKALTKMGRLASVKKNCHPLKVLPNRLHPILPKNLNIYKSSTIHGCFTVQCKQSSLATVTSRISTMLEPLTRASFQSSLLLSTV